MAVNGIAVAALGGGAVFAYSALNNKSLLSVIKDVISGKKPVPGPGADTGGGSGTAATAAPAGNPGSGPVYNSAQLESLWIMAGGSQARAKNAACHGMQESSGNSKVTSSNPDGGTNVGLWQLDTPGGKGAGYSVAQLQDPMTNARVTVSATKNGTDWSAWATPGC